jgi:hypothetical protein
VLKYTVKLLPVIHRVLQHYTIRPYEELRYSSFNFDLGIRLRIASFRRASSLGKQTPMLTG